MKKSISLLMLLVLVGTLVLGSCGPKAEPSESGKAEEKTTAKMEEKQEEKKEEKQEEASGEAKKVVIWAWDQNLPSIEYAVGKYKEMNPDKNVEAEIISVPDTVDKISTFFASGIETDLPDIVLMDNNQIQVFLQTFSDKFVNLSDMGYDQYKDKFSAAHWEVLSTGGSIYAFPFDIAPVMVEVNTEIMEQAGVDPASLKTWDDVIAATAKVNDAGFGMHTKFGASEVYSMLQSSGLGLFNANNKIDLMNPKFVEVFAKFKEIVDSNTSDPVLEGGSSLAEGKVAMKSKPAWAIGEDMPVDVDLAGKVTLIPLPKVKDEDGYTNSANDGGSSFFILSNSKVIDEAYGICEIITTDMESQNIALAQGLMPGNFEAATLDSLNEEIDYYQGQKIWVLLSESAVDTPPLTINNQYSLAKDVFSNSAVDPVLNGTDKSVEELLEETAQLMSSQTGIEIEQY